MGEILIGNVYKITPDKQKVKKNMKFHLETNLSEKQIETDISQFFCWLSPGTKPMRLLDINEQKTGADKLSESDIFGAIYMQFKVSRGLLPITTNYRQKSSIQKIIDFRNNHHFSDDPILYFRLREKAKNAADFQHNILFRINDPKKRSFGIYVSPLCLDKDEYFNQLFNSSLLVGKLKRIKTFEFKDIKIQNLDDLLILSQLPILKYHFSIAPHVTVTNADHYYSYSDNADNICWHSGEYLENISISRLSDFFYNLPGKIGNSDFDLSFHCENLKEILFEKHSNQINISPLDFLYDVGKYLFNEYRIKQYLLVFNNN